MDVDKYQEFLENLEEFKNFYISNPYFPVPSRTKLNIFIHKLEQYEAVKNTLLSYNFQVKPADWCSSRESYIDFELTFGPFELSVSVLKAVFGAPEIQTVTSEVKRYPIPEEILRKAKPEDKDSLTCAS